MNKHTIIPDNPPVRRGEQETKSDVVIIGGGPNGLICAAYLARAGLKVTLLERRQEIGGGLATEEVLFPNVYANTHAVYHMMVDYLPIMRDFDLKKHTTMFMKPVPQTGLVFKDGSSLLLSSKMQDTSDEIAKFSWEDSRAFDNVIRDYQKMVDEILAPGTYYPPVAPVDLAVSLTQTEIGNRVLELTEMSPREIIENTFKDERVRALFLYISCMWGLAPEETGLGFMVPLLINRASQKCVCLGGSHKLASGLGREIFLSGGTIEENTEVTRVILAGGRAVGVEDADGRRFLADVVVSSLDPQSTFLRLVGSEHLPKAIAHYANGWEWDKWSMFTLHLALNEPPAYRAVDRNINRTFMNILGIENMQDVIDLMNGTIDGQMTRFAGHATTETVFDATLRRANTGIHSAFLQTIAPYGIEGGWETRKNEIEEAMLGLWRSYAPNLNTDNILIKTSETPLDIERRIPCMVQGSIKHGDYNPLQMGYFRPNDLCSSSRTPIDGLYLCGASTYPGGLIIGGPGYIAANIIAEDANVEKWWEMPDFIKRYVETYIQ